jgi:magnesium-transporting ATPase (P-type)
MMERLIVIGIVLAVGTLGVFWWELSRGSNLDHARTVALTTMVLFQLFNVFNARSETKSALLMNHIPFVVGRMKAVDASQFEYTDNYNEFNNNLTLFKTKFPVPDAYKDGNESKSFESDFTGNYWSWGGSGSNGSDPLT